MSKLSWCHWKVVNSGSIPANSRSAFPSSLSLTGSVPSSSQRFDATCAPTSVWAAYNVLRGEKTMVNMVSTGHGISKDFGIRWQEFVREELGLAR